MASADYTIQYSGSFTAGALPKPLTFAALGVTAATVVSAAGGDDYAEITVDTGVTQSGIPFLPFVRTDLYNPAGTLVFSGWLVEPGRAANGSRQQQTFRFQGPNYLLNNVVFKQYWAYALDPTDFNSALGTQLIARVILYLQNYVTNTRVNGSDQIKAILDAALEHYAKNFVGLVPFAIGSLAALPVIQPPEDEQVDQYCGPLIKRALKWMPMVTAYWTYGGDQPTLNFSAYQAVANVGSSATGSVIVDLANGTVVDFKSKPRYDLLLSKVHIDIMQENDVTDDGSITGTRKLWAVNTVDESTADNGSPRELVISMDLRGAGGLRDPATGKLAWPQEFAPTGLAAAIHAPFKQLSHSLSWSVTAADVDWTNVPGWAVGVKNAGDAALAGSRAIIQTITRDLKTGTTSYEAGPPAQLTSADILALTRYSVTRNSARGGGGGGGGGDYSKKGGPLQQQTGVVPQPGSGGGGGALGPTWFNITYNGYGAYCQINAGNPTDTLPDGSFAVNTI